MSKGRSVANDGVQIALHFWMVIQNDDAFQGKSFKLKKSVEMPKTTPTEAVFDRHFTWMDIC